VGPGSDFVNVFLRHRIGDSGEDIPKNGGFFMERKKITVPDILRMKKEGRKITNLY
jgi:hypothetical protein